MIKKTDPEISSKEEDIARILKISQRDFTAFLEFYNHTAKIIFTFLFRLLKDRVESEDILQETFWQVWRQAGSYQRALGTPPTIWALTFARNLGMGRLKQLARFRKDFENNDEDAAIDLSILAVLPQMTPPPSVRANLLHAMEQEKNITPRLSVAPPVPRTSLMMQFPWMRMMVWVIAGLICAGVIKTMVSDWETAERQSKEMALLRLSLSEKEDALLALRLTLSEKEESLALIEARKTIPFTLTGKEGALGKIFWNSERNTGLFFAFDLPSLREGKVYQLWAHQENEKSDAGVFSSFLNTDFVKMKPIPNPLEAILFFTATAEPPGGSSQPTGEVVLKGEGL